MVMLASGIPVTTVEQLLALPEDGLRHELLCREHVVTPGPERNHQRLQMGLIEPLVRFVSEIPHLELYDPPSDLKLFLDTLVQPDLFVLRVDPDHPSPHWPEGDAPELVIEVLSPTTATRDRGRKREIYQEAGVAEYWIVDIDAQLVERWKPADDRPEVVREKITWQPDEDGATLTIDLVRLFDNLPK